jgi:hypothetical protein
MLYFFFITQISLQTCQVEELGGKPLNKILPNLNLSRPAIKMASDPMARCPGGRALWRMWVFCTTPSLCWRGLSIELINLTNFEVIS